MGGGGQVKYQVLSPEERLLVCVQSPVLLGAGSQGEALIKAMGGSLPCGVKGLILLTAGRALHVTHLLAVYHRAADNLKC